MFMCMLAPVSSLIMNCQDEVDARCRTCEDGYYVAEGDSSCIHLGCKYTRYCLGCTNGDAASSCTGCTSGYSSVTLTTADESLSLKNCFKNLYEGVCVILGKTGCKQGCQLDLDKSIESGIHEWECLPEEEEDTWRDDIVDFDRTTVAIIIVGVTGLTAAVVGVLVFFLACV